MTMTRNDMTGVKSRYTRSATLMISNDSDEGRGS